MPVLTIDRTVFFFLFFFLADLSYVGFVLSAIYGISAIENKFHFLCPKINPLRWIYF